MLIILNISDNTIKHTYSIYGIPNRTSKFSYTLSH